MNRDELATALRSVCDAAERLRGVPTPQEDDGRFFALATGEHVRVAGFLSLDVPPVDGWELLVCFGAPTAPPLLCDQTSDDLEGLVALARMILEECSCRSGSPEYAMWACERHVHGSADSVAVPAWFT